MADPSSRNVIDLYDRNAAEWESLRGTTLTEQPWLSAFLAAVPAAGKEVLDIGCGSGVPVARWLIGQGCRVTGVDGAAALIDRARSAFPDHRWIVEDMRTLSLTDKFHGLVAWHSFFHLPAEDQPAMFGHFGRLSAPGGGTDVHQRHDRPMARQSAALQAVRFITPASMRTNTGRCWRATDLSC